MSRSTPSSRRLWGGIAAVVLAGFFLAVASSTGRSPAADQTPGNDIPRLPGSQWRAGDWDRPQPPKVAPGETTAAPPADAVVLFDGKDLSQWESDSPKADAAAGPLRGIEDGAIDISKTGQIRTKRQFGDCQLHVEWATPAKPDGDKYNWGNSGVFFIKDYELQILESRDNYIYADGIAGAIYNQTPPLVNPSRLPGQWQSFDVVFRAPRFDGEKLTSPGYFTVLWNGVLVQDHTALMGSTLLHNGVPRYTTHATAGPIMLQYHHSAVRFRNIWVRPLKAE